MINLPKISELRNRKLIADEQTLRITKRGIQLINDYNKINSFLIKMKLEYIQMEEVNSIK